MKLFSSIYIGSYGIVMKIYSVSKNQRPKEIDYVRMPIGLVHEIERDGRISLETTSRVVEILLDMKNIMKGYKVDDYRIFAGFTISRALNEIFLLEQIRLRTGFIVRTLTNSEQRFMEYVAVAQMNSFEELIKDNTVVVDLGGSSVQMTIFRDGKLVTTQHLALGTFSLRENYRRLINLPDHREQLSDMIHKELDVFQKMYLKHVDVKNLILFGDQNFEPLQILNRGEGDFIIDSASFEKAITSMDKKRRKSDASQMDGYYVDEDLGPILLIHRELLQILPAEKIVVPEATINDGIAYYSLYQQKLMKATHDFHEDILTASWAIAERYGSYKPHLKALQRLSVDIFDTMKKYHGLGAKERELCEVVAILHDCGKYISISESAECSHRIILASEILGLTHKEREIVAAVVKYHRLELPEYEMMQADFTEQEYWTVIKLLAILKVANALDRSHKQKMKKVSMRIKERELILGVESDDSIALEKGMFKSKADFFEEVFAIRPVIRER